MGFPDFLDKFREEDCSEYFKIMNRKVRNFFIIVGIAIFILLLILEVPIGVVLFIELCIGFIWLGYQIETIGEGIDTRRARIKKLFAMGIPTVILTGFIVLGIEHNLKTSRTDVLRISRKFGISFIGGLRSKTLALCWIDRRKEVGEEFDKIRLLGGSLRNVEEVYSYRLRPLPEKINPDTYLVTFSRFGATAVCTYETTVWTKPVFLTIELLNGENLSLWQKFLKLVSSAEYLGYLFPYPYKVDCWMVSSFKVDDGFEKVLREELEKTVRDVRIRTLKSKLEEKKLSENEKREYEKYEQENKEALERGKSLLTKFSDKDYRDQLERKRIEFYGNWIENEIQSQLKQVKTWRADFDKIFE